jgi:uncharacterized membrane protein YeiB
MSGSRPTCVKVSFVFSPCSAMSKTGGRVRAVLALPGPAGRMALTNYQSVSIVITVVVLTTYTYGRVGVTVASVVGLLFWLMQVA